MNFIRSLALVCTGSYPRFGPKRIYEIVTTDLSKSLMATSRREIHIHPVALLGKSTLSEDESQVNKYEDKRQPYVDEWFSQFLQRLKTSPDLSLDWKSEFQDKFPKFPLMIMAKMISFQDYYEGMYQSGISLMEYLKSNMTNNSHVFRNTDIIFLVNKISLAVHQKNDHSLALELYKDLLEKVTSDGEILLDHGSCSVLISALSKTKNWKECLKLLEASNTWLTRVNTSAMCSNILEAAIRENDDEVSQKMLDSIEEQDNVPSDKAFQAIVRHRPLSYLMKVLRDQRLIISESVADDIKEFYEKSVIVKKVKLNKSSCSGCGISLLPSRKMSPEEVKKLADTFSEKVFIRRNDSFLTSDPKEIEEFKKFLASREKYDVVIDALNIMFRVRNLPHKEKILNLFKTVVRFTQNGKRVLVMSRAHFEKDFKLWWKLRENEGKKVDWFFLNNQTKDDLFLLYSCLYGNNGCIIVTRDELRDHRFLLGTEQARVFKRWQQKHQVLFEGIHPLTRELQFKYPPHHEVVAQVRTDGTVHIPYMDESIEHASFSHTNTWLCIKGLKLDLTLH